MMEYTLIRSKRKTIAIHITKYATVEVRAPLNVSKAEIDRFVQLKQAWIKGHLDLCEHRLESKANFTLNYGDTVLMQGKEYPIVPKEGSLVGFDGQCFYMPPHMSSEEIKGAIEQIYKMIAKNILTDKVIYYSKAMRVKPTAVKINGAKTRWGSCSNRNSLNFSWRLIMADDDAIDYVVVHELAHIKEHNHSQRFWSLVESQFPDYKMQKEKLKELQRRLSRENWV